MKTGELVMHQCVAFLVDVSASLVLKKTTFLQPQLPTQLAFPSIFCSFLEGALGLANPLNAFSFHWLFAFIPYLMQPLFLPRSQIKQLGTFASLPSY
jgi:hypothetical protein